MEHQITRILSETRWRGVMLWNDAPAGARAPQYMGCLIGTDMQPDHSTNVWDWRSTVAEVLSDLLDMALGMPDA